MKLKNEDVVMTISDQHNIASNKSWCSRCDNKKYMHSIRILDTTHIADKNKVDSMCWSKEASHGRVGKDLKSKEGFEESKINQLFSLFFLIQLQFFFLMNRFWICFSNDPKQWIVLILVVYFFFHIRAIFLLFLPV